MNLDTGHAWVSAAQSKNRRPIAVPLNTTALEVLRRQLGKHPDRVFTYRGRPITGPTRGHGREALKRAGIDNFRWHDLRHTWASWHRQSGTPTHELQRLGGWRSSVMVERYAHLAPDHLAQAANRLDSSERLLFGRTFLIKLLQHTPSFKSSGTKPRNSGTKAKQVTK